MNGIGGAALKRLFRCAAAVMVASSIAVCASCSSGGAAWGDQILTETVRANYPNVYTVSLGPIEQTYLGSMQFAPYKAHVLNAAVQGTIVEFNPKILTDKTLKSIAFEVGAGSADGKVGDYLVKKGELLFRIDSSGLERELYVQQRALRLDELNYELMLNSGADEYSLEKARLAIEKKRLQVERIESEIEACSVYCPIDGAVVYSPLTTLEGASVASGQELCRVILPDEYYFVVTDENADIMVLGDSVTITGEGVTAKIIGKGEGRAIVAPEVRITAESDLSKLFYMFSDSGYSYRLAGKDKAIVVPETCVNGLDGENPYVLVLEEGSVQPRARRVEIGIIDQSSKKVEIVSGLSEGEEIVY